NYNKKACNYILKSAKNFGILQPVIVMENGDGDGYRIIAGERRIKTAKNLGLKEIPAAILESNEVENNEIFLLLENLIRKRNIAKESETVKKLIEEKGYDIQTISKITGIGLTEIRKLYNLSIKLIPEIFKKLKEGEISPSTALKAMQLKKEDQKALLAEKITLRKVEEKLREYKLNTAHKAIKNLSIVFCEIDRQLEIKNIKEKIKKYAIKKEELFQEE
ncbi:MAG: ParB/RepB/Spo0J family partition protein, partial [Candidatus Omnitrophica bacterium]|nr:ParB/RepB/Spo0J family partition protein [Candidatus Omnitrophota bacterium]